MAHFIIELNAIMSTVQLMIHKLHAVTMIYKFQEIKMIYKFKERRIISDLSERFACYLNEVAYMFVNNQASFCNAYHLDNGTIDGMLLFQRD